MPITKKDTAPNKNYAHANRKHCPAIYVKMAPHSGNALPGALLLTPKHTITPHPPLQHYSNKILDKIPVRKTPLIPRNNLRRIIIWLRITKSATPIPFLSHYSTSTLPAVETTTSISAISVVGARSGDELFAGRLSSCSCPRPGSCNILDACDGGRASSNRSGGATSAYSAGEAQCFCSIVVRSRISKTTASIPLLCYDCAGAFSGVEAAAAGCAVCV